MGKKYLETKKDTLESSVLGVWKTAVEERNSQVNPKDREDLDGSSNATGRGGAETAKKMKRAQEPEPGQMAETNKNDKSDDGEGLDAVQPKAVKKKFKDRKDRDIDNDGDVDDSDKFLHKRRKAVSKAIAKEEVDLDDNAKEYAQVGEFKVQSMKAALASIWGMEEGKNPFENKDKTEKDEGNAFGKALMAAKEKGEKTFVVSGKKYIVKEADKGNKTETGKKAAVIDLKPKIKD